VTKPQQKLINFGLGWSVKVTKLPGSWKR